MNFAKKKLQNVGECNIDEKSYDGGIWTEKKTAKMYTKECTCKMGKIHKLNRKSRKSVK